VTLCIDPSLTWLDSRLFVNVSAVVGVGQLDAAIPSVRPNPLPLIPCSLIRWRRSFQVVSESFWGPAFGVGQFGQSIDVVGKVSWYPSSP